MQVSEFVALSGCKVLTGEYEDRQIVSGYTCDLLSHVMGKGQADMAWITVQAHMNVIAVASLMDFACVIIPESLPGLDCGSCGSPTCRALAQDIVGGYASEMNCIFKLNERISALAGELVSLGASTRFSVGGNRTTGEDEDKTPDKKEE